MSMTISAFHTYGFLITDEVARHILQHIKDIFPDLYNEYSGRNAIPNFQEYLSDVYGGCCYGNADYMTVWRIKDHEELNLNPGASFFIIELHNFPSLFAPAYSSYEEVIREINSRLDNFLPSDFPLDDFLVEIMGEIWG